MKIPLFDPGDDPGPSFTGLLEKLGLYPQHLRAPMAVPGPLAGAPGNLGSPAPSIPHGTTVVAVRYADGVLMAGDRRATAGNLISHRSIEKVFPADSHSVVGIAGAAGPAVELVRLFQLQLEHYEKVEGTRLSFEGKANQLGAMIRGNLAAAMQGLAVVPLFAGYDLRRNSGRLIQYDVTGGRYEERDHAATGSGSLHAGTVLRVGYREGMSRDEVIDLALEALYRASEEDAATGGPDLLRGIFPIIMLVTASGYERVSDDELRERTEALLSRVAAQRATAGGAEPTAVVTDRAAPDGTTATGKTTEGAAP
ncbi:MAG TPA: proteasome subunit beta [Acidimicrobiales bacterium]